MKRAIFLFLLLSTALVGEVTNSRNIAVNSKGYVYAEPDRMAWTIHIVTEGSNVQDLKKLNDESSSLVYKALSESAIPKDEIRSSGITFRTAYKKDDPPHETKNVIQFNTDQLDVYPNLMDQLVGIKYVYVKDTDLYASNHEELEKKATELALIDAREKAKSMLAVYGESLGEVLKITEGYNFRNGPAVDYFAAPAQSNSASTSQISTGKIKIEKEMSVIFKIKDSE